MAAQALRRTFTAAIGAVLLLGGAALRAAAQTISGAQLEKLLKLIRGPLGTKVILYAPVGYMLDLVDDPKADVSALEVGTGAEDAARFGGTRAEESTFARSDLDKGDFVITTLDKDGAYMFATHADFQLSRALYHPTGDAPRSLDVAAPATQTLFQRALLLWSREINAS